MGKRQRRLSIMSKILLYLESRWVLKQISLPRTNELWEDSRASWGLLGEGWWHSLPHHSKMKINYWKPERQPNGKSLQTWRAQSCALRVAKAVSPHALSVGPTVRPEECDDMTEGLRARSPAGGAPGNRGTSSLWRSTPLSSRYCHLARHMMFKLALS